MPMIDVYAPASLFPADADQQLGTELTLAVLRAEGHDEEVIAPFFTENTAAFVHRLPVVSTAGAANATAVRVQIVTPPGSLGRDGQRQITKEATEIVQRIAGSAVTTWVILTEAAEGGWGLGGTAFGQEEFAALAARAAAARAAAAGE
jgi:phenylpyruvate tautomerase PptA (4-oxalocrotonate tautomerase family)